jgi:hypothetical protein
MRQCTIRSLTLEAAGIIQEIDDGDGPECKSPKLCEGHEKWQSIELSVLMHMRRIINDCRVSFF